MDNAKIVRHLGVIRERPSTGWRKEVNLVEWHDSPAKVDIREWAPDHEICTKGLSLSIEDAKKLIRILEEADL